MSNDLANEKVTPRLIDLLVEAIAETSVSSHNSPKAK
jgi:hypothetical protein